MSQSSDPTDITAIAVRREDVLAALEANERGADRRSVIRITAPYSGRMRARLHREGAEEYELGSDAIHVDPSSLLETAPDFPGPDDTEDELRSDPDRSYSPESHREYHEQRVREWRRAVQEAFGDRVDLDTSAGTHEVDIVVLGDP